MVEEGPCGALCKVFAMHLPIQCLHLPVLRRAVETQNMFPPSRPTSIPAYKPRTLTQAFRRNKLHPRALGSCVGICLVGTWSLKALPACDLQVHRGEENLKLHLSRAWAQGACREHGASQDLYPKLQRPEYLSPNQLRRKRSGLEVPLEVEKQVEDCLPDKQVP